MYKLPKTDLQELFVEALNETITDKKKLAYLIADIINIETESVYRRLSGKVNFSIYEMGVIAKEMNISLDTLLNKDRDKTSILFELSLDANSSNMDNLVFRIEELVSYWQRANAKEVVVSALFDSLPLEFYMFHPYICKYIYFKWGYYYIRTKEFDSFSGWEIPQGILDVQNKLKGNFKASHKIRYFWDLHLIPNIVKEINYHLIIGILTPEDAELIKQDIHKLLDNYEEFVKRRKEESEYGRIDLECYVTNLNIGVTAFSVLSDDPNLCMSAISSSFMHSAINYDRTTALKIDKWIDSIKKVSCMISGGGDKERVMFFKKQHDIVNTIGTIQT